MQGISMTTNVNRIVLVTLMLAPCIAHAYVGPGAGLSAIGSALALIGAVLLLIVGFVWYPIKRLLKQRKGDRTPTEKTTGGSADSDPK